jgi:Ser/Thr protein kinase RdoA (MazF antagonist)
VSKAVGRISLCPHAGCAFRCCEFQQGNYIVLYPGELKAATASGQSIAHLEVFDDAYHGGQRARCIASDTASCDHGYKPLDCATYPFFPTVANLDDARAPLLKGTKCPLPLHALRKHAMWAGNRWRRVVEGNPAVAEWIDAVDLVGYEPVRLRHAEAEDNRPRRTPPVTQGQLSEFADLWSAVVEPQPISAWENFVYRAVNASGRTFLRISESSRRSPAQVDVEVRFLQLLYENSLIVPRPVPAASGDLWVQSTDGELIALMFTAVPGNQIDRYQMTDEMIGRLGETLASLHRCSYAYLAGDQPLPTIWFDDPLVRNADDFLENESGEIRAIWRDLIDWVEAIPRTDPMTVVHGDVRPANFIVADDGSVHLIDFDDLQLCWPAYDVGVAVDSLAGTLERFGGIAERLSSAYSAAGGFAPPTTEAIKQFALLRRVQDHLLSVGRARSYPESVEIGRRYAITRSRVLEAAPVLLAS